MKESSSLTIHIVKGESMSPYLVDGDLLLVEDDLHFQKGDLILFEKEKELFVHRFLGATKFKGDNLKRYDQEYELTLMAKGRVTARTTGDKIYPVRRTFLVKLLSFTSQYNHADIKIFHRAAAFLVHLMGSMIRSKELSYE